jgi:chitinase
MTQMVERFENGRALRMTQWGKATRLWRVVPTLLCVSLSSLLSSSAQPVAVAPEGARAFKYNTLPTRQWVTAFWNSIGNRLSVNDIPYDRYTHIIHFAGRTGPDCGLKAGGKDDIVHAWDSKVLVSRGHAAGVKVLLNVGGGTPGVLARCTSTANVKMFVSAIAAYVDQYHYDGVDLDWESDPVSSQYDNLINEFHRVRPHYILTLDVYANDEYIFPAKNPNLAQVNLMCYDRDGANDMTRYNSSLRTTPDSIGCDSVLRWFEAAGVSPRKLGLGMPFYGRRNLNVTGPWQHSIGPVVRSAKSVITYRDLISSPVLWQDTYKRWDANAQAQYLSIDVPNQKEFISYTGEEQLRAAVRLVRDHNYGGIMVYSLEYEYCPASAGDGRYPLTTALVNAIKAIRDQ